MAVKIIADPSTGNKLRLYSSNPEFAYCVLQAEKIVHRPGGFIDKQTRTTILRAKKGILQSFIDAYPTGVVDGQIVIREFTESECPESFMSRLRSDVDYEVAVQTFLKRPQDDAPVLTKDGERILRFTDFDPDNVLSDVRVEHDNQAQIAEWRASKKQGQAFLPGSN